MIKRLQNVIQLCSGVGCGPTVIWSWPQTLSSKSSRDQNCAVKLPVLTKWLCVPLAVWPEKQFIYFELKTNVPTQFKLQNIDFYNPLELFFFCCLIAEYLPPNMYIFMYFMCCYWFRLKGWGVGLSLYTVTCPLITDYHRLFVLWPVAAYKISHRSWRMLGNSLSGIQHGTGIFGKSNFISTNMRKMKTNTTQTANYHPLGPLSPIFLSETQNGRLHRALP